MEEHIHFQNATRGDISLIGDDKSGGVPFNNYDYNNGTFVAVNPTANKINDHLIWIGKVVHVRHSKQCIVTKLKIH